jgi:eukaryotic-like serine/threonine-protein kinase
VRSLALVLVVGGVAIVGLASVSPAQTQGTPLGPASDTEPTTPGRALLPWTAASRSPAPQVDGMELVYVPAGDFLMGSDDGDAYALSDEKPQHLVYLDAYWIDKTEVTNAMFDRFVEATGHETDAERDGGAWVYNECNWSNVSGANWRRPEGPGSDIGSRMDHPVVQVSWSDAEAYCRWAGRRLPTEAEWEKAARGSDGRKYPWGEGPPAGDLLNFADVNLGCSWADLTQDDGHERTAPVGTYPAGASPYGVLDMAGNVSEWVADWYGDYYAVSPKDNPQGPATGTTRVVRGGSWDHYDDGVRAAYRNASTPDGRFDVIGFRCARSPSS